MPTKEWFKRAPIEPDALRPLDGDTRGAELYRKSLIGRYHECACGWFYKTKCPKCPEPTEVHQLDVMA